MGRFIRFLKGTFWNDWPFSLLTALSIAFIAWFFYVILKPVETTVGISSDSFNILCGVVATLNGALLGLMIAAIGFITHRAIISLNNNKEFVLKEGHWLESWLSSKKFKNEEVSQKLETFCDVCKGISTITEEEMESEKFMNITSNPLKPFLNLREGYQAKLDDRRKKIEELKAKNISKDDKRLLKLEKEARHLNKELAYFEDYLKDSSARIDTMLVYLYRIRAALISFELVKQLERLASISGFIMVFALIVLVLSGGDFFVSYFLVSEFPADLFRLCIGGSLILLLAFAIIMINRTLSLNRRIVDFEVGRKR